MALSHLTQGVKYRAGFPAAIFSLLLSALASLYAQTPDPKTDKAPEVTGDQVAKAPGTVNDRAVETSADNQDFDLKNHTIICRGHVVMTYGTIRLHADKAEINTQTKQAHAEGHVRLNQGYGEFLTENLNYNFETGAIKTSKARGQMADNVFVEGASLEGADRKQYVVKDSFLTTSDYSNPDWRIRVSTIVIHPNDRISLRHLVLFAGPIPLFYFPYMVVPLDDYDISSGTQVQIGKKSKWGFFVLNSYTTKLSDNLRPTYRLDYRMQRGIAGGVDLRYQAGGPYDTKTEGEEPEPYPRVSGKIKAYYADDQTVRNQSANPVVQSTGTTIQNIKPQRYQVRVTQRADLSEEVYSKLKVNKLSDPNFLEDYFDKEFIKDPQPDNFAEVTKWSPNTTLSLMGRPQFNRFFTTTERLPEARFELKRQPIFDSPLFYEGENSVDRLYKRFPSNTPLASNYNATRLDSFHQILYPKQYFGWLSVTPRVGGRATFYDRTLKGTSNSAVVRSVFNTGVEVGFKVTRTWNEPNDKQWEIDGLRHIIEPSVNYAYVARPSRRPDQLPQFDVDRSSFGVNRDLTPIDFPQFTGIDSINKRDVFRPTLRQRLQTRRDGQPWDLAELLVYQDILADKTAGPNTLSDLFAEFTTKPVRWLSFGWNGRYDYTGRQLRESTTTASVFHDKIWKLDVSHSYFRGLGPNVASSVLGTGWSWALNENWTFRTTHRFDPTNGTLFEQAYAIDRDLHSWILTVSYDELRPLGASIDRRVWLAMTLKAFPEVSVNSRQIGGSQTGSGQGAGTQQ